jgi:ADP-ribosylglycohydrolase
LVKLSVDLSVWIYWYIRQCKPVFYGLKKTGGEIMMPKTKEMVLISLAADSLALGAHWIYDTSAIDRKFGRIEELLKPLENSFHPTKDAGEFTHYGDQTMLLLEYLMDKRVFELREFAEKWLDYMKKYDGYMDNATKQTIFNMEQGKPPDLCGSPSSDLGGASRISPLIFTLHNEPDRLAKNVREQTAMTHNNPVVIESAALLARITLEALRGTSPLDALQKVLSDEPDNYILSPLIEAGLKSKGQDTRQTISGFGQMCEAGSALPSVIHLLATYENDLKNALIENVMAGGDSAARGMIVGMVLGAYHGENSGIPNKWINDLKRHDRIIECLEKLR